MDQDERTTPAPESEPQSGAAAGVSRSQNTVYTLPHDWALIRRFLSPALERAQRTGSAGAPGGPAVLVVTSDVEGAVAVADAARRILGADGPAFIPATATGRATRLIRGRSPIGVSGTAAQLGQLMRNAVLKLDDVSTIIMAWADDLIAAGGLGELEGILGELPKSAARVLVTTAMSDEISELVERVMRRPRHIGGDEAPAEPLETPVHYVTTTAAARPIALRRLLDELDPTSAVIVAGDEDARAEVRLVLATLGYGDDDTSMQLASANEVPDGAGLVLLYELPETAEALRAVQAHTPKQLVALLQPRQIAALRAFTGDAVAAYTFGDARRDAAAREDALRDEIRTELSGGAPTRELLALEPLLAEHDGVEIAAALLHLLSDARRQGGARGAAVLDDDAPVAPWTRVYVNVGTKDGVGAGDVLGALAGEGNVGREKIGRIELRDTHTLVDVSTDVVDQVVEAATGASLRGRRITARVDKDRASTPRAGSAPASDRPPRGDRLERSDRGDRGDRAPRGERPPRGDRPERGPRFERSDRGDRGPRGERPPRGDRPAPRSSDRFERSDRGPRPDRGDRPERGDRGPRPPREGGDRGRPFRSSAEERQASYGRTLRDEQAEWASRADRLKNARRPRNDE